MTEKELILTSLLNCRRIDLYTKKILLTPSQENRLYKILQKRQQGDPLQYLLGKWEFMGLEFFVNKNVLVPRPETEILVEAVVEFFKKGRSPALAGLRPAGGFAMAGSSIHILDLGTGSGNIAVSLAKLIPNSFVKSVDISKKALSVAQKNARYQMVEKKVKFILADMKKPWEYFIKREEMFDIIVSNPPYIKTGALKNLPEDVRREPRLALNGGKDGLDFYRKIAVESVFKLKSHGQLFLEVGDEQAPAVKDIIESTNTLSVKKILNDYRKTPRMMMAEVKTYGKISH